MTQQSSESVTPMGRPRGARLRWQDINTRGKKRNTLRSHRGGRTVAREMGGVL